MVAKTENTIFSICVIQISILGGFFWKWSPSMYKSHFVHIFVLFSLSKFHCRPISMHLGIFTGHGDRGCGNLKTADTGVYLPRGADIAHLAGGVANRYLLAVSWPKVGAWESQQGTPLHWTWLRTDLHDKKTTTKITSHKQHDNTWENNMTQKEQHDTHKQYISKMRPHIEFDCGMICIATQKQH